ncbi:hypothetical protein LguiA_011164 [Lonicera macranthoides]
MMMNSPISEHEHEGTDLDDEYEESETFSGCFRLFCFPGRRRKSGEDRRRLVQQQQSNGAEQQRGGNWLNKKLNELKEVSEIVAGPKWKNFIRRFGKYWKKKGKTAPFQYDLEGYALNFDGGEEEERLMVGFSSRFAPPLSGEINKERDGL